MTALTDAMIREAVADIIAACALGKESEREIYYNIFGEYKAGDDNGKE